jgi:uncharacterized protein DUF222
MDSYSFVAGDDPDRVAKLDRLGDEIAELSAHLEAATARLLDLIREFDARGGWNTGFRSCAAWLSWRVGLDPGAAREKVRVARALGTLPLLAQALSRGELSYAKVRALTRVATPETEERLLGVGRGGTAAHVERIVRGWRRVDRNAERRESKRQHASRALHVWDDEDGTVLVRGRLTPELGVLLRRALAAARETLYQRRRREGTATPSNDSSFDVPTVAQQQADALGLLAETALHHELDPGAPGERYQVVVHVDAPALADPEQPGQSVLEGGTHVSAENVSPPGVRCEPGGDAPRRGRARGGDRGAHADNSAGVAARAAPPGSRLPLPGLRAAAGRGPSHPSLGQRRPHHAGEPRHALSPPPPRRPRRGVSRRSTARRRASVPAARRPRPARRSAARRGACRCGPDTACTERDPGTPTPCAHGAPALGGRASGPRLGDRCAAPAGQPAPCERACDTRNPNHSSTVSPRTSSTRAARDDRALANSRPS